MAGRHDDYLLIRLQEVCNSVPLDPKKSWGPALCELAQRTSKQPGDHAAFYMQFMEGIRDLLNDEEEDRIVRRFLDQSLASEPRIQADDRDIRDHLTHVTQVFLTGWIILNSCPVFTRTDWEPYGWHNNEQLLENLNQSWLYAALLHDCAYSVEYAKRALGHELAVRNLFQDAYLPGIVGASNTSSIKRTAEKLWNARAKWRGVDFRFHDLHQTQYARPDHGIVGAIALWEQAQKEPKRLKSILKPAALAIACHNFQYIVADNPRKAITAKQDDWLRLSFKAEPISVLLHICDELQEWGRERIDEAVIYKHVFKPLRYAATELTHLDVHGYDGLTLDVRLLRRLYPEHRPLRHRIVRGQERAMAKTSHSFERLFGYSPHRKPADAKGQHFHVRLRVQQTVDDTRCKQELRVDWPSESHNVLARIHEGWEKQYKRAALERVRLTRVALPPTKPLLQIKANRGVIDVSGRRRLRRVIVGAGGSGKSTLLQRVAYNFRSIGQVLYIEQMPDELVDIQEELGNLSKWDTRSKPTLLIVDHLDRLVEDENAPFWLEQISATTKIKNLNIVLASRTEEYERYFRASLKGFNRLTWPDRKKPRLVKGVERPADDEGRLRAHSMESRCVNMPGDWPSSIAALAVDMGQRRTIDLPRETSIEREAEFDTSTGKRRIVFYDQSGKTRFLHDCLQDFFSAVHIVQCLSGEPTESLESDVIAVRQLEHLARDVVRLLFDVLASEDTTLLSKETKEKAALRLASALIEEPTIQQWLYDTGRLQQARYAVEAYANRYKLEPRIALVARKFLGHSEYERFNPKYTLTHKTAKKAFSEWVQAGLAADQLLGSTKRDPKDETLADRYRWFVAFLVDHLFLVLTRALGAELNAQQWIQDQDGALGVPTENVSALESGWLQFLLRKFHAAAGTPEEIDGLFRFIDEQLGNTQDMQRRRVLDVRRAHLASHLGNHFLSEGRKKRPNPKRLNLAAKYFQNSISRREFVLREMEREPLNLRDVEVFSTLCQGYADNAHQYRGIFECLFLSHKCVGNLANLAIELIQAHRLQEAKWAQARLHRGPSEHLPNMFRTSLPWLATGRVLTELVESLPTHAIKKETVQKKLRKEAKELLTDYRQEGEVHARYAADDLAQKSVFGDEAEHVAAVLKIAKAGADLLSGGKQKS